MSELFTGFAVPGFVIEREPLAETVRPMRAPSIVVPAALRSPAVRAALARGDESLAEVSRVYTYGTYTEQSAFEWRRAALVYADSIKARAIAAWEWQYGGLGFSAMLRKAKAMKGRGE